MKRTFFKCLVIWFLALLLVLALSFLPVSCRSYKSSSAISRKDSIATNTTFRKKDTVITVPGQKLVLSAPLLQLENSPAVYKTDRGTLTVRKDGNNITAECNIEEYKATITLLEKTISIYSQSVTSQEKLITEQNSFIKELYNLLKLLGGLTILFLAVAAFFVIRKKVS